MKRITTLCIILLSGATTSQSLAQTEIGKKIRIPHGANIVKVVKVSTQENVPEGAEIKSEKTVENKKVSYTITTKETAPSGGKKLTIEKPIEISMSPDADGWANLTVDEKDKSILHVNYWLNPRHEVPKGRKIITYERTSDDKGNYTDGAGVTTTLTDQQTFYLYKVDLKDKNLTTIKATSWYKNSNLKIEVYDKAGTTVEYELINRYDRDADYQLKLQNRQFISYRKKSIEYGPIVIPVKYRFERTKGTIKAKDEFQADLNVGIYGGYRFGKYRVRYEGGSLTELSAISVSVGGFLNVGTTTIDSAATTLNDAPFSKDEKASIGVFSPGLGIMLSIYNLQIGLFGGVDFGFGNSAKKWNFNNQPWLGFGVAYNVTGLWKK